MSRLVLIASFALCLVSCGEPAPDNEPTGFLVPDVEVSEGSGVRGGVVLSRNEVFSLTVTPNPAPIPMNEPFALTFEVARTASPDVLVEGATLQPWANMPEHNHGMKVYPRTERIAPGTFETKGMLFHMRGFWELVVNIQAGDDQDQAVMRIDIE